MSSEQDYDYIVIGSGFGGSVSALRLSEKGYKVLVIEKGRWMGPENMPKTNWNLKDWLWLPGLRLLGLFKLSFFRHVTVLSGVGVGGGSLVYANTLPIPKEEFFQSESWSHLANWEEELKPFYKKARTMLGAVKSPYMAVGDKALRQLGKEIARSEHFKETEVSVYFGEPEVTKPDPFFGGKGPDRTGCQLCGACMTGCRHNAKNSLDKNYLYLARKLGARIQAESEVYDVVPLGDQDGSTGYKVHWRSSTSLFNKTSGTTTSKGIVFSGGVMGTIKLLLKLKMGSLPLLSNMTGANIRTNSESLTLCASLDRKEDFSKGVAIGSILDTDGTSHLEIVRYGAGSGFWRLFAVPLVTGKNIFTRILKLIWDLVRHPWGNLKVLSIPDWAKGSHTLLFMQTIESTLKYSRGPFGLMISSLEKGEAPTAFMPDAFKLANLYGKVTNSKPMVLITEALFGIPNTAHILGGAVMGINEREGVIDKDNRVFGYKNMLVCDGSMVSANIGVNPSLTITALSERALSKVPVK
ncbi:MAG: GMC family oxidoreductase [Proteobacteria bacterium]|nr:GMC family oxidoreductase [Pseudomonadota bacterium]